MDEVTRKRRADEACICHHTRREHAAEGPCRNAMCGCLGFRTPIEFVAETQATMDACRRAMEVRIQKERDYPE